MAQPPGDFPSTHWSLVYRAAADGRPTLRREALDELLRRYLGPLKSYLVRGRGVAAERADDLLQAFVVSQVLEKELIATADEAKGKFRTFLLTSLNRFVAATARHEGRLKRGGGGGAAVVSLETWGEPLDPQHDPSSILDVEWARAVLAEAVERMRRECAAASRADVWGIFEARILGPALDYGEPVPFADLMARFELSSPKQVSNVVTTAKRMFARCLRGVVAEYAGDDEAGVDAEIADLEAAVSRSGRD